MGSFGPGMPALLNRQSKLPNRSTVRATSASMFASRATSVLTNMAAPPSASARRSPFSTERPAIATRAPSATNTFTVRAPIPLVPPVMIAVFPFNLPVTPLSFRAFVTAKNRTARV